MAINESDVHEACLFFIAMILLETKAINVQIMQLSSLCVNTLQLPAATHCVVGNVALCVFLLNQHLFSCEVLPRKLANDGRTQPTYNHFVCICLYQPSHFPTPKSLLDLSQKLLWQVSSC